MKKKFRLCGSGGEIGGIGDGKWTAVLEKGPALGYYNVTESLIHKKTPIAYITSENKKFDNQ